MHRKIYNYSLVASGSGYSILAGHMESHTWYYWNERSWNQCLIPGTGKTLFYTDSVEVFNAKMKEFGAKFEIVKAPD